MPCRDWNDIDREREEEIFRTRRMKNRLNLVESVLCAIFTRVEKSGGFVSDIVMDVWTPEAGFQLNEVENWWKEHKAEDVARREREAATARKKAEEEAKEKEARRKQYEELKKEFENE